MTKYLFLDIDGTLYSTKLPGIPESALQAVRSARRKGHKVYLCTGRSLAEVSDYLTFEADGFILGAGANVYTDGRMILDHPMKKEDVTAIKKIINDMGMGYSLEGSAGAYCNAYGYDVLGWYLSGRSNDPCEQLRGCEINCTYTEEHGDEECDQIYKICAFGKVWEPYYPELERRLPDHYVLTKAMELKEDHFCIGEVTDRNYSKAEGVRAVLEYYGASEEDAYGFGDSGNDIPMFTACGTSVAMGNATEEAKEAADYVTDDILEDGLAKAFRKFGLSE